jgi:hypothetical protein
MKFMPAIVLAWAISIDFALTLCGWRGRKSGMMGPLYWHQPDGASLVRFMADRCLSAPKDGIRPSRLAASRRLRFSHRKLSNPPISSRFCFLSRGLVATLF